MVRAVAHISLVPSAMVVVEEHVHNYCADEPLVLVNVGMLRRAIETLPDVPDNLEHLCYYYILFSASRANAITGKHFNRQPGTQRQAIGNRSYAWTTYLSHIE